jgi:hypothetical protein
MSTLFLNPPNTSIGLAKKPDTAATESRTLSRFAQLKQGVMSTVRAHPYLVAVSVLALLTIFRIGKGISDIMNDPTKNRPHPLSLFVCSSCSKTKKYWERASKSHIVAQEIEGLLCTPCEIKAFQTANNRANEVPPFPRFFQ